jgi:hypothetical protein
MAAAALFWRRYVCRGRGIGLSDAFIADFNIAQALVRDGEFREGVRALMIDKDKSPRWKFGSAVDGDIKAAEEWADKKILSFDGGEKTRRFAADLRDIARRAKRV